jgi:hypothetical protein
MTKNSIPVKIPKDVYDDINKALKVRLDNGLISMDKLRMTEGFRLLRRTNGYQESLKELKIRPKVEDCVPKFKNKKGEMGTIFSIFMILGIILFVGFALAILTGIFGYVGTEITPILNEVASTSGIDGMNNSVNATFGVGNIIVQSLPVLIGAGYVLALIFSLGFAFVYRFTANPIYIGVYFALMILLFIGSVLMSNSYQDIYEGTDVLAVSLQSQSLMSYMILYSPFILCFIATITGIFMFARPSEQEYGGVSGFQ